ncbi:MAG TPA: TonB-dependent receptor [Sphingobium sp.]|nr:TonB-dependent receptor [Sphingobium sp.]
MCIGEMGNPMIRVSLIGVSMMALATTQAAAQPIQEDAASTEIIVTANRRSQDVTKVPYNISVVGSEDIERSQITSFEDLTRRIPNLNINAAGNRTIGAQRPVMRGLNASATNRQGSAQEQAPVATYIGNVPFGTLFPIDDVERVEVLRGPQGTLYGAGALGGAVRILPTSPKLKEFSGSVNASVGVVRHSDDRDYRVQGVVNIPLGEIAAFRVSAQHQYEAGFVDRFGILVRKGGPGSAPLLSDPSDVTSSAVRRNIEDQNWSRSTGVRASLKVAPTDELEIIAAYNFAKFNGRGGPEDNPYFAGGADPSDPRIVYPAAGENRIVFPSEEPYDRRSHLASLDASYDFGFATLSSTTSYTNSRGSNAPDITYLYLSLPSAFLNYYTGVPVNPNFNGVGVYEDKLKVFTQELRLVSSTGGAFDYVVGGYFQHEKSADALSSIFPGQERYAAVTQPFPFGVGPGGESARNAGRQKYIDRALFGELTWNVTPQWQITGGARIFWQTFRRNLTISLPTFGLPPVEVTNQSSTKGRAIFKLNSSYEFTPGHNAYATFSQGFRRGGANAFATVGLIREDANQLTYKADTVDNFEFGVKGRLGRNLRYSAAVFWDEWQNPQIGLLTPVNRYPVVVNGSKARSRGFEVEISGDIAPELSFTASYAYSDPKLREGFCVATGTAVPDPNSPIGDAILDPCGIRGDKGGRLPGSSKSSANLGLLYSREIGSSRIEVGADAQYTGSILTSLPLSNLTNPPLLPSYWTANARVGLEHGPWEAALYVKNVFDKRALLSVSRYFPDQIGTIDDADTVSRPRQVGLQVKYSW